MALHFGADIWNKLNELELKIVTYVFQNGKIHVSDAQRLSGNTWITSKKNLEKLVAKGMLLFESGDSVRNPKSRYRLVNPPKDK